MDQDRAVPVRITCNDRSAEFDITFSDLDRAHAALEAELAAQAGADPRLREPADAAALDLALYVDGGAGQSPGGELRARELVGYLVADLFAQEPSLWDSTAELGLRLTVPEQEDTRPILQVDWTPEL
jgi:hypothetical protein